MTETGESASRALAAAGEAAATTPVQRLHFRKDAAFWEVVENAR